MGLDKILVLDFDLSTQLIRRVRELGAYLKIFP